jgi:hypothetical protein
VKGEAGEVVAPEGSPDSVTVTGPVKPFCPAMDTAKEELVLPGDVESVAGEIEMLKSLVAGGGEEVCWEFCSP